MNQRAFFGGWKQTDIFGKTHLPKENKHIARGCERIASRGPKRNGYFLFFCDHCKLGVRVLKQTRVCFFYISCEACDHRKLGVRLHVHIRFLTIYIYIYLLVS